MSLLIPRVTTKDIARVGKVHQTTVSLALRNDPRLPAKTRDRLRRIAEKLGYRPDPMLSALNFYRTSRHAARSSTTIAFLLNFSDREELASSHSHQLFLQGATWQAEQIGYHLDTFYVGHNSPAEGRRLERILSTRGISGVILGAFSDKMVQFQMDWNRFSAVAIESHQLGLSLHTISSDQMMITRDAIQHLHVLGYRRIGLAVGEHEEIYLRNAYTGGYYIEMGLHPELVPAPPLLLATGSSTEEIAPVVASWANTHKIEVIASNWPNVPDAMRLMGRRVPQDLVVASLDINPGHGPNAGMEQPHRIVGARAVEQLAIILKTNQRGLVEQRNCTRIEGRWVDGPDVPARTLRPRALPQPRRPVRSSVSTKDRRPGRK